MKKKNLYIGGCGDGMEIETDGYDMKLAYIGGSAKEFAEKELVLPASLTAYHTYVRMKLAGGVRRTG